MYKLLSNLVMYRIEDKDSIIVRLADIIRDYDKMSAVTGNAINEGTVTETESGICSKNTSPEELRDRIFAEVRRLLEIATSYAFDKNLWQDYLAFTIMMQENPFALTCERKAPVDGSAGGFALSDMNIFYKLFHYDFGRIEEGLGIDTFSIITDYKAISKREQLFNRNVSEKVRELSSALAEAADGAEMLSKVTEFYEKYGVGMFGMNRAFRIRHDEGKDIEFIPIRNTTHVLLDDLVGYELQKKKLRDNTEAFVAGKPANNCLLFGDSGTGKSTSIKAIINEYYPRGLRMIELYKHEMRDLATVISMIKNRNYRFIIYMDDLSFEDFEVEYKYLKAVIEGGLEARPDNVLIYATSNRRHLIRETWTDNNDVDLDKHSSDTLQEKMSLVNRFGITIGYMNPNRKEFEEIVRTLASRHPEITMDMETLLAEANKWEVSHGGFSGRTAQQFVDYMLGGC